MDDVSAWHRLEPSEALLRLGVDGESGLTEAEAARRLAESGPNELAERGVRSPASILLDQFASVTISQTGNVMAARFERDSLFCIGTFTNRPLLAAVALTVILQMALVYLPGPGRIFMTVPLSPRDLALCVVPSSAVFWGMELRKRIVRRGAVPPAAPPVT